MHTILAMSNVHDNIHTVYARTHDNTRRRTIYKDVVGSQDRWRDYQLRPNICVAMTVAPELFSRKHARAALQVS